MQIESDWKMPAAGKRTHSKKKEDDDQNVHIVLEEVAAAASSAANDEDEEVIKKRGRKPKGGKLVTKLSDRDTPSYSVANVILHLKCTLAELEQYHVEQNKHISDPMQYNPTVPPEIQSYSTPDTASFTKFDSDEVVAESSTAAAVAVTPLQQQPPLQQQQQQQHLSPDHVQKMKKLKVSLYKNAMALKKAACFWCTYDFDNDACYIPKTVDETTIHAYGSFCRPECAVGYLMNENVDDSTKFERYHLLNQVYGKAYGYRNNIKPAPDPYYLLDKFYGNQTIQEYRKLLASDHLMYTLDKPMTRILPELHEVTDDFILGIYGTTGKGGTGATQAGGVYKVKRQSEKQQGPSKASIIRGKFGMTQM
jgi:hypothetical protein